MLNSKRNIQSAILATSYLLFIAIVAFVSALYGQPELDEGLVIQWALSMKEGALLYNDFPVVYGPLYFWINKWIFANFGFLHLTSRVFAYLLGFCTFILMAYTIKKATQKSWLTCLITPSVWFILSSQRFSESLHPGWYISLILSIQALLLLDLSKLNLAKIGISSGLMLGFKPHIAIVGIIAIAQSIGLKMSLPRLVKYLPTAFLILIFLVVLKVEILKLDLIYLFPFFLAVILFTQFSKLVMIDVEISGRKCLNYFIPALIVGAIIYLIAADLYGGVQSLKYQMIDLPRIKYPNLNSHRPHYQFEYNVLWFIIYLSILAATMIKRKLSNLFNGLIVFLSFQILVISSYATHEFVMLHLLLFLNMSLDNRKRYLPLFLLSGVQILHLHPIVGTQLYYASPILWILVGLYYIELANSDKIAERITRVVPLCLVILSLFQLPLSTSLLLGKELGFLANDLGNKEYILMRKEDTTLVQLVNYIKKVVPTQGTLFTLPPYYSLNLLSERKLPNNFVSPYLSFLEDSRLNEILPTLVRSDLIVLAPRSNRARDIYKEGTIDNKIYQDIQINYKLDTRLEDYLGIDASNNYLAYVPN